MSEIKKYPKFVVGVFLFNNNGELFLRTTPSQGDKFTCLNNRVEWGNTIEETIRLMTKEKTNLDVDNYELIGLTDGLNIKSSGSQEQIHMVFADYKVIAKNIKNFKSNDESREYKWLTTDGWLKLNQDFFGPYIYEIIQKINQ